MVLRAVGPCTSEPTVQCAQRADLIDVEQLPSMWRAAVTLPLELKTEQGFDTTPDAVVMRFDDSSASAFVDELDESLVTDRAHEVVIHGFTASRPSNVLQALCCPGRLNASGASLLDGVRLM